MKKKLKIKIMNENNKIKMTIKLIKLMIFLLNYKLMKLIMKKKKRMSNKV